MSDVYEKVECKGERPEYVLKNGKSINVYGMLKDVHSMQGEISELREELKAKTDLLALVVVEKTELTDALKSLHSAVLCEILNGRGHIPTVRERQAAMLKASKLLNNTN